MPIFKNHPCPTCGTVKYKSTSESHYVCKNGHQMAGYVRQEGDVDAFFGVRRLERKKVATEEKKFIRGVELEDVLKRLFQYGLQVLSRSFVVDLGFPDEFEYVLRELWLLYITNSGAQLINAHDTVVKKSKDNDQANMNNDVNEIIYESDTDSDDDGDDSDSDIANENINEEEDDKTSNDKNNKINGDNDIDNLKESAPWPKLRFKHILVFCYLTCNHLGWPVLLNDIHRWCATFRLPYLSILKSVPANLVNLLDMKRLLPVLSLPGVASLRNETRRFGNAFQKRCGLVFPKMNTSLIIYRFCTQMILPVEMYFCARTLFNLYPSTSQYISLGDLFNNHRIDLQIMAVILTLVKMCYGLDDQQYDDLRYENSDIPPPLPKHIWLKYIKANIKRWDDLCTKNYVDSSDLDLSIMIDYLQNSVGSIRSMKDRNNWKSMVRSYIVKTQKEIGNESKQGDSLDNDLFGDISQISEMLMDNDNDNTSNNGNHDININGDDDDDDDNSISNIRIIGNEYLRYSKKHKATSRYPEEYETVLLLASRITGYSVKKLHHILVDYDSSLEGSSKTLINI